MTPQDLADRYTNMWNETGAEARRGAVEALWVADGVHYVNAREARGYDALEARVIGSHEKNVRDGGNRFRAQPNARRLRDVVTFNWEMNPAGSDEVLALGLQVMVLNDDGQILRDYQFIVA